MSPGARDEMLEREIGAGNKENDGHKSLLAKPTVSVKGLPLFYVARYFPLLFRARLPFMLPFCVPCIGFYRVPFFFKLMFRAFLI